MSKIIIVDDKNNYIGVKSRSDIDYEKDIYQSSALWVVNTQGEALVAQRKLTKDKDPGKWGPSVAGTVDEGEDYDINVYKEAEEEIGLTGYKFQKGGMERLYAPRSQFVQWYKVLVDEPLEYFTAQEEEVEQLQWIDISDLHKDVEQNPDKYVPSMGVALDYLGDNPL